MQSLPPLQPSDSNTDEIRVLGLITFVSILVGAAIAVFDAGLWLRTEGDVRTNAATYAMGAFTLQGMSFVLYKLLMQENLDHRATFARMDRDRARKMQGMQQVMANKQMEVEMKLQEAQFMRQLNMLEHQNELEMNGIESSLPQHAAEDRGGIDLGGSKAVTKSQSNKGQTRDKGGKFASKKA
tara:strand:- start:3062 stop:3610 length:549 start_codon:yes stop_codon:yes gene_type:complete